MRSKSDGDYRLSRLPRADSPSVARGAGPGCIILQGHGRHFKCCASRLSQYLGLPGDPPMANLNMSEWMLGGKYTKVYTPAEFNLLRDDPLCFFAVYERFYLTYASLSLPTGTGAASEPTSTSSEGLSRRQIGCHNAPESCKNPEENARTLYLGYLPDQIHMVYKHTPTEVTVKETGTTSCGGFTLEDQMTIAAFETTYGVFEYRYGQSPKPEPAQSSPEPSDNLVKDDAAGMGSLSIATIGYSTAAALTGLLS